MTFKSLSLLCPILAAILLAGCGSTCGPSATLLRFGHVYDGRTMKPYQGKLPFQVLWPSGLKCFALYLRSPQEPTAAPQPGANPGTAVVVAVSPPTGFTVACPAQPGLTASIDVAEFPASDLAGQEAGLKPIRLGSLAAREQVLPTSGGKKLTILYLKRGEVGVEVEGLSTPAVLKQVALSLRRSP